MGEGGGCEATLTSSVKYGFVLNLLKKKSYCLPLKSVCVGWEGGGGNVPKFNFLNVNLRKCLVASNGKSVPTRSSVNNLTNDTPSPSR